MQSEAFPIAAGILGAIVPLVVFSLALPTFNFAIKRPTLSTAQQAFVFLASIEAVRRDLTSDQQRNE